MIVGEQGLPKLAVNQRVRLFFEAFPYQRYGTVTGRLEWFSPVTVTAEGGQHFMADASLDRPRVPHRMARRTRCASACAARRGSSSAAAR